MSVPVSLKKLAYLLNLPADWLKSEAEAGRIPCLNAAGRYLFEVDAVKMALAERAARERLTELART